MKRPDLELARLFKLPRAQLRKEQAKAYRRIRKNNPAMARLLWRLVKDAEPQMRDNAGMFK